MPYLGVGLAVHRQSIKRSFVRYLDVVLRLADLVNMVTVGDFTSNFTLSKIRMSGSIGTAKITAESVDFSGKVAATPVGFTIDFGSTGLDGCSSAKVAVIT